MGSIHNFKDDIFDFKMTPEVWFYSFDKVMNDYMSTLC